MKKRELEIEPLLTVREAAKMMGMHPNTVRKRTDIPHWKIGGRGDRRYKLKDVEDYLASCRVEASVAEKKE